MIAIEEARHVEIGADILDDDIRRVAPASDGHVAVRERESLERRRIRAANHLDARARAMGEPRRVHGVGPLEIARELRRDPLLSRGGAIGELGAKRRSCPGVDTQGRRALRKQAEEIFAKLVEQGARIRLDGR